MPEHLGAKYKSLSQKARVITEAWAASNMFCPNCDSPFRKASNNLPATDFYCDDCRYRFELKSRKGGHGGLVIDGAYKTMIDRIKSGSQPHLLLLGYTEKFYVDSLVLIPSGFLVRQIVERRPPLSKNARRAGWVGCNLRISGVPTDGNIVYVTSGKTNSRETIHSDWQRVNFLNYFGANSRSWMVAVMTTIKNLEKPQFTLSEIYAQEAGLKSIFPNNNNIRAKIRQQLQRLRDVGWLTFVSRGVYRRTDTPCAYGP